MPRQFGYTPYGKRCAGKYNGHAKTRFNVIGALFASCLLTVSLFNRSLNTEVFSAGIEPDLLPKLPPHGVIVMDNATFHQSLLVRQLIEDAGPLLDYLPTYSPDWNPIEHQWAQAKAIRRQKSCCSVEELFTLHVS